MLVSAASKGARTGLGGGGEPHHPHHTPTTTPGAGLAAGLGERRLWASKSTFKPHWPLEETGALETLPCDQLPNPPTPTSIFAPTQVASSWGTRIFSPTQPRALLTQPWVSKKHSDSSAEFPVPHGNAAIDDFCRWTGSDCVCFHSPLVLNRLMNFSRILAWLYQPLPELRFPHHK